MAKKEIENNHGAITFILSALTSEEINLSYIIGCKEDTFIIIKEYDASNVFRKLAQRLRL